MKENNLWLSSEELQHMLHGSLQWLDVEPRLNEPRNGFRKIGGSVPPKEPLQQRDETEHTDSLPHERNQRFKVLEGQPVIWLLGSVGLLTLFTWFYFLLF